MNRTTKLLLVLAVCGWGLALLLLLTRPGAGSREAARESDAAEVEEADLIGRPREVRTTTRNPVDSSPAATDSTTRAGTDRAQIDKVREARRAIEEYCESGVGNPTGHLHRIRSVETPEVREVLIELLANTDCDFPHRALSFERLLRDVDDPRVGEAAAAWVRKLVDEGRTSRIYIDGYLALVALHHGAAGEELLLQLTASEDGQLQDAAATQLALHGRPEVALRALDAARRGPLISPSLLKGIGRRPEEGIRNALRDYAGDQSIWLPSRTGCMQAFGQRANAAEVAQLCAEYWQAADPEDRTVLFSGLRGAVDSPRVESGELVARVTPVVQHALSEGGSEELSSALYLIEYEEVFQTEVLLDAVRALSEDPNTPEDVRSRALETLAAARRAR